MHTRRPRQIKQITGENIRAARLAKGIRTQRLLAEKIGVTNNDVWRWEKGRIEPGPIYRQAIADVLFDGDVSAMYREQKAAA